jgi:Arc/MetJ-type ribon-helix-helix transcriptional regulator
MTRKPKAYLAALPLSSLPELQELLARSCGGEAPRGNVVMVRLGDAAVAALDQLVEAGLFGSRSEAAAFLVGVGIDGQRELLKRVAKHSAEIRKIRQSLKRDALMALRCAAATSPRSSSSSKNRKE